MAASFSSGNTFHASIRRPTLCVSSSPLAHLSSISSCIQPVLNGLRQSPMSNGIKKLIHDASSRIMDGLADSVYKFSDQPWLPSQRNFMPVDEIDDWINISTIEGDIPHDFIEGVYIRNGSNPLFGALQSASSPLGLCSETWVEGEGMLHAVSFYRSSGAGGGWTVSYKNRFVESETLLIERRRNRPSILPVVEGDPPSVLVAFLLNQLRLGKPTKDLSNTNVFEHGGRVFSIAENHMPHEIDPRSLETIGSWDLAREWNRPFIAHPKKAPGSGDLVFVGADVIRPFLVLGIASADGKHLKHKVDLKLERSILCHDIGVTERYNVILDMPLTFDMKRLLKGGPLMKFDKEGYARIGVMPRYGDANSVKWFEVECYCTLHIVNCYELDDEVVVLGHRSEGSMIPGPDFGRSKYEWFSTGFERNLVDEDCDKGLFFSRLHEWRLNMITGSVKERYLTGYDFSSEFPIINDRFGGLYNRFAYSQIVNSEESSVSALGKFGGLVKFHLDEKDSNTLKDLHQNDGYVKVEKHQLGANQFCSGSTFIARQGSLGEDDGWIVSFVHNESTNISQVHIIDARNVKDCAIVKITLPRTVPYGFHGAFFPMCTLNR